MFNRVLEHVRLLPQYPQSLSPKPRLYKICAFFISALIILYFFFTGIPKHELWRQANTIEPGSHTETKALVVVTRSLEVSAWIADVDSSWSRNVYLVNEDHPDTQDSHSNQTLFVPVNKGNEAMRYLSFIIDHYDSLPDITVFRHGHNESWDQRSDAASEINYLNLTTVRRRGYQNFRCDSNIMGCDHHIHLGAIQRENENHHRSLFARMQREVLEGVYEVWDSWIGGRMPEDITAACCAQFAVMKENVHRRTREKYLEYRQWLIDTPLDDDMSGRVLERLWHVIFGLPVVMCEPEAECICQVYTGPLGCGGR